MNKLNSEEIDEGLSKLKGWIYKDNEISKKFVFEDFNEAFSFISRVALLSEKLQHHPNWDGVYNKVNIALSTHDASGVTKLDFEMAIQIDKYAKDL